MFPFAIGRGLIDFGPGTNRLCWERTVPDWERIVLGTKRPSANLDLTLISFLIIALARHNPTVFAQN